MSASEKQSTVSVALLELKTGVFVGAVVQMFDALEEFRATLERMKFRHQRETKGDGKSEQRGRKKEGRKTTTEETKCVCVCVRECMCTEAFICKAALINTFYINNIETNGFCFLAVMK